jgi:hypothetical protein
MKKKVKRYAGEDKSLVEIEERSIKTPRLKEEELAKGPMDYATMGARARATSPFAGPKEYISETKETETESEAPKGIAAGFDAKRYLEESESKGGGPRSETKPTVAKKAAPKKVEPVSKTEKPKSLVFKDSESKSETNVAKIGSQGNFRFESEKPSVKSGAMTRAGTPVSSRKEPTEAEKESGKKFSESKLAEQKRSFESTPLMRALTGGGRSEYYKKKAEAERSGYGMKKGGKVSSASSRADGIAQRGKTKGRIC